MSTSELDTFITSITSSLGDFSTSNLSKILVAALGASVVLGLAWFAYRFVTRKVLGAMKKGKVG